MQTIQAREGRFGMLNKKLLILISIITSLIIAGSGYFYYYNLKKSIHSNKEIDLTAIAQLKINQLEKWLQEKTATVKVFSKYEAFSSSLEFIFENNGDDELEGYIQERIAISQKEYNYKSVFIVSSENKVILSTNPESSLTESLFNKIIRSENKNGVIHSDFYYDEKENAINYDIISPILNAKKELIALVVFRVDPANYLYPLIQSWPTPSKTSETLLIRKEQDQVLFLNELRHKKGTALKLSISLSQKILPAVMAVEGTSGIVEGIDYRGSNVIAYVAPVSGTEWFMVTKVDEDELFKELVSQGLFVLAATVFVILAITFGLGLFYNLRQKNVYLSLWETQEEFKTTLYSIGDAVITTDNNGIVKQINKIAEELTGWKEKEAKDKPLLEIFKIINEETRQLIENPVEKVLSFGDIVGLANHTLLISKNGVETPIADSAAPIRDNEGNILGVVLVFRDQTDEKRHLEEIKLARDFAENIIKTLHNSLLILDPKLHVISANDAFYKTFATSPDKIIGQHFFEMENRRWVSKSLKKLLETILPQNTKFDNYQTTFQFKTIGKRVLNMNARRIYSTDKKTKNILLSIKDITETQELIEELIVAKEKAEESDQLKTAFLANMSHEIRTPLNGILGFSSMIAEEELSKDIRENYLKIIENSGDRLLSIVNDILDISMIQSNQIKLKKQKFQINDFLNELFTFYQTLYNPQTNSIDFSLYNKELEPSLIIFTDKDRLFQIFKNLIDNAFKFTKSGFIYFGATQSNGQLNFFVKDSGLGIPADKMELIFEKFQQISTNSTSKVEGTGLGLTIAKGLVERLGGKISLETEPNKGTAFYFNLPLD